MTKRITIILSLAAICFSLNAQEKISTFSHLVLDMYKKAASPAAKRNTGKITTFSIDRGVETIQAIITLNEESGIPVEAFNELGVNIINGYGNIITANIPVENFYKVADIEEVEALSISQKKRTLNDKARQATKVDDTHNGINLPKHFKGKDVIVGIVDVGIDFNHINFKDSEGNSRVKLAGSYNSSNNSTTIYKTVDAIAKLTTDETANSHGTHVAGIATGSYTANNYHGMAPESDIVLYGLGSDLTDVNILNGVTEIFNYAESVNKPAVVNISLGGNTGPHDGTDSFTKALDLLTQEGKIALIAAGNEGSTKLYLTYSFSGTSKTSPQLSSIVEYDEGYYDYCIVDTWSRDDSRIGIQFFVYDTEQKKEVKTSGIFYPSTNSTQKFSWSGLGISVYFSGNINATAQLNSNNRYSITAVIDGSTTDDKYRIGIKYYGTEGTTMDSWASPAEFVNSGNTTYTEGSTNNSFNDLGCGKEAITIGAYSTKKEFTCFAGTYQYPDATVNEIANFSSYGTDINGKNYPDITAPGYTVVSSVNKYDNATVSTYHKYLIDEVSVSGTTRKYHWGEMAGTSMATPVATGVVALWLQANPYLTPEEVRSIMQETAITDTYTQNAAKPLQWGAGKLNAYDGLVKILQRSSINDISLPDDIVLVKQNTSNGNLSAYIHNADKEVSISIYSLNGTLVYNDRAFPQNGMLDININGLLSSGVYIVKINGENTGYTSRIIIK